MFEQLANRLQKSLRSFQTKNHLTDKNIQAFLQETKESLLDSDVGLSVGESIIQTAYTEIQAFLSQKTLSTLKPKDTLTKIMHTVLSKTMGEQPEKLSLETKPPIIILVVGLQGSGKTTTVAKLAHRFKTYEKKSVIVTTTDTYRPAAKEQLATLAKEVGITFYSSELTQSPTEIAIETIQIAKNRAIEIVIVDTAGRLPVDNERMQELQNLQQLINPKETLLVVDGMGGQDTVLTAQRFKEIISLNGIILTKMDSDARGGAALSVRFTTGKPIKFIGNGEKSHALEIFYPDRMASRLLGMGDISSLLEEAQNFSDVQERKNLKTQRVQEKELNLEDLFLQFSQMRLLGGMSRFLDKLPLIGQSPLKLIKEESLEQMIVILSSMTPKERRFPALIRSSQKRRIAAGSGTPVQAVNQLLRRFEQMKKTMKRFTKVDSRKMLQEWGRLDKEGPIN